MRLHLSFTRRRSSSLSEPGRFENAFKSGAFSKRYGFIGRVNGETASIINGLARNWLAREVNMVNLARSAALSCTITTLICGLTSLFQLSRILLSINREAYRNNKQRCLEMLTFSKKKAKRRFWIRPGRTRV